MNDQRSSGGPAWQVEGVRLTAFPVRLETTAHRDWWSAITGEPADEETERPRANEWRASGVADIPGVGQGALTLRIDPTRIDWLLQPVRSMELGSDFLTANLGPPRPTLEHFVRLMTPWLQMHPAPIQRLALGSTLTMPVTDRAEGAAILSSMLRFEVDANSTDFLYRVNRPEPSIVLETGASLNRLATWSLIQVETVLLAVTPHASADRIVRPDAGPFHACRLELDVNTPADRRDPLPDERLLEIAAELAEASSSFAERGDRT